jgi:hypothetical protein
MNLGELVAYRERVQALERELAQLAGRVRASSNAPPPRPPTAQPAARQSSSAAPSPSSDSGHGWQNPAPASAPRLPPRSESSRAVEVEHIETELAALERAFQGCARNVRGVRQAFTGGLQAAGLRHRPG